MQQATITIGAERRIVIDKALQAGEKIEIAIAGLPQGTDASGVRLALCAPTRATVAACVEFAASGQAAAGEMSLATSELAALLSGVATGRLMHVAAVIFDAATEAVYGSGYVPIVALPIGPQFDPIPEPLEYVTQAMLDAAIEGLAEVARTGDYDDLTNKPTIPAPVEVVAPSTDLSDAGKAADAYATGNTLDALAEAAQFKEWFPVGEAKSISDCTPNLKFDWAHADEANRTVEVLPFSITSDPTKDNSDKAGRVVIPPYVDHAGTRYTVVGVAEGDDRTANESLTAIVAPTTVTSIGEEAFARCANLSSVSFPAATNVGDYAFCVCSTLATVPLPAATSIGMGAFTECDALATVSMPDATSIGESAFAYCPTLAAVSLPVATSIGESAFDECTALTTVDFGPDARQSVPSLAEDAFPGLSGHTCRIIVPDEQFDAWTTDTDWAALTSMGYEFVRWSDTQPATKGYVDAGLADKQDTIADLAAIRSGAALGATAVQPGQRNLLDYAPGTTLSPATAVYRTSATLSGTDATIPTPDASAIPTANAYYCFEMEVSVDATATSIAGPAGWVWLDGGELPDGDFAGKTLYIAARLDCQTRAVVANVWRVEEAAQ